MRNKSFAAILLSGITAVFLIGCGGGGSSTTTTTPTASSVPTLTYSVSVIDDNVVGATVSAPECATFIHNGGSSYTLKECIAAPSTITAVGGFVDVDGDGTQGATEVSQTAPLILKVSQTALSNNFAVTPLSTLASQETNLTALASALNVSEADFFQDNVANRNQMRAINAILISAREAGITKYDLFISDLKELIKTKGTLAAAQADMMDPVNLAAYKTKYGFAFGGFVDDTTGVILASNPLAQIKTKNTVSAGKVRYGGFVADGIIPNATVNIYDGVTLLASTTSDINGRYSIEVAETAVATSKVLKFEATAGTTKLIAYITTDELKEGMFGKKVSSGTVEDLVISNVTTAKAVMVDKLDPTASTNAATMTQTKAVVESLYADDVLKIASSIKAVVDGGSPMTQIDTLALASAVAAGTQTADATYSASITADPILNGQLNSTTSVPAGSTSLRSVMEGTTFYQFDYRSGFSSTNPFTYMTMKINTDASMSYTDYRNDSNTSWIAFQTQTTPAGTFKWSSDGNTAYDLGDYWMPTKHTFLKKEVITSNGVSANIYFTRDEVTADGTQGFFTNFAATSEASGTYDSATKSISITYSDGWTDTFYLGNNGYLQFNPATGAAGTDTMYRWETITRYSKNFVVAQNGDSRNIYYISGTTVYKKNYDPIGTVEISWMTDSPALLYVYKNMTQPQRDALKAQIPMQWNWQIVQTKIYDFLKSL